jgi:hypothetical protein
MAAYEPEIIAPSSFATVKFDLGQSNRLTLSEHAWYLADA